MYDTAVVRRLERVRDLPRDLERFIDRQRALREPVGERLTLHQLQDESLDAVRLFETVDRRDVRMVQSRQDLRLPPKSRQPIRVRGKRLRQDLDRHVAV